METHTPAAIATLTFACGLAHCAEFNYDLDFKSNRLRNMAGAVGPRGPTCPEGALNSGWRVFRQISCNQRLFLTSSGDLSLVDVWMNQFLLAQVPETDNPCAGVFHRALHVNVVRQVICKLNDLAEIR
jgi:hypothetical protein